MFSGANKSAANQTPSPGPFGRFLVAVPQRSAGKRVADISGHLTLRSTRGRVYSEFKGSCDAQEYEVLAADSDSVAIVYLDSVFKERRIQHIHFDGDHYWIALGRNREFFRRMRSANQPERVAGGMPRQFQVGRPQPAAPDHESWP